MRNVCTEVHDRDCLIDFSMHQQTLARSRVLANKHDFARNVDGAQLMKEKFVVMSFWDSCTLSPCALHTLHM